MTDPTAPVEPSLDEQLPVEDIAAFAIVTDEGPDALDIPDEPPGPRRDTAARPEDGPQDVDQTPVACFAADGNTFHYVPPGDDPTDTCTCGAYLRELDELGNRKPASGGQS